MCLAVPGRITEVFEQGGLRMGRIDYAGTRHIACLECVHDAGVGAYVLVHAGFAISVIDEEAARRSLDDLRRMVEAAAAEGPEVQADPGGAGEDA